MTPACRRRRLPVAALLVTCLLLGACGVGAQDSPELLAVEDALLDPVPPTVAPSDAPVTTPVRVAYVRGSGDDRRLAWLEREIPLDDVANPLARLTALLGHPSADEIEEGYSSAIPEDTVVHEATVASSRGLAAIDLSREFLDLTGQQQRIAFAQVVFTVTEIPGIDRLQFQIDGERRAALTDDGTSRTVTRDDYQTLRPAR